MAWLGFSPCLALGNVIPVVPPPFFGHSPFRRWWRSSLLAMHGIEKGYVFLFSAPQASALGPCFRSVDLFPPGWNGGFHLWRCSGGPLDRLLRPMASPRFKCPECRFTWSPELFLLELLPPSRSGCGSYRCPSCSSHPSPAWFSSNTSALWVPTVASAPVSERAFAFGSFSLLGIQLGLVAFYPSG